MGGGCLDLIPLNAAVCGSVNNGQWNAPAHKETARLAYFKDLVAAVKPYLALAATISTTAQPTPQVRH